MPDQLLKPAIRAALRMHEIGDASPYQLSFAAKAKSGASFGFMQGDLAAKQPSVTQTFITVLSAQNFPAAKIKSLVRTLSVHVVKNPLSKEDTDAINAALRSQSALVDKMDEDILTGVYQGLDACLQAAGKAGRSIDPKAQLYIALWINMSGPPTNLLTWLSGGVPHLPRPVPPAEAVVTAAQMEAYLRSTSYYIANSGNFPHLLSSVAAGATLLPGAQAAIAVPNSASLPERYAIPASMTDHLVYEQATGRFMSFENGLYDTIGTGYSGSLSNHGVNDPDQQCAKSIGPIPRGVYAVGPPGPGPSPYSLPLTPDPSNHMCGRSGFLIHGDSIRHPRDASDGCIILKLPERQAIVATGLSNLIVVDRVSS